MNVNFNYSSHIPLNATNRIIKVGLLLGTTPQTRIGHYINYFFIYRIDAAEQLYKSGKIEKILISGDENSLDGVNEPKCMRDSLVARGVPDSVIILDGKGFRSIYSIINARNVFGYRSFTIISQQFHNERALYQAEHLGLDVQNVQAFNAKNPNSKMALMTYIREYFARVKLFWDLLGYTHECFGKEWSPARIERISGVRVPKFSMNLLVCKV